MTAAGQVPAPRLADYPEHARRIALTVSCRDADSIRKVADAGEMRNVNGTIAQVMHNGVLVEKDSYCGPWMTEIIRCLRGHHEPQEERVFSRILAQITATESQSSIIELGSWWSYYSLWFLREVPEAVVLAMEPDPAFLEVGRRNFALNCRTATFVHGAVGPDPGTSLEFLAASDGRHHVVPQYDLSALMALAGIDKVGLVLADIQGAETAFIEQARALLARGLIRFLMVSTHHHTISGDPLTHQTALKALQDLGGHIIAEHSVGESFSGDGLIAVSFDPRDRALSVDISLARQRDSLFGELEPALAQAMERAQAAERRLTTVLEEVDRVSAVTASLQGDIAQVNAELAALRGSRVWRWSQRRRQAYWALRRLAKGSRL